MASRSRMSYVSICRSGISRRSRAAVSAVDAASPKKYRRMSLSMPTTRKPSPLKVRTASDPIKPAAPVTMTVLATVSSGFHGRARLRFGDGHVGVGHQVDQLAERDFVVPSEGRARLRGIAEEQ